MRCQICLQDYKKLRFHTKRIRVCRKCVQALNDYHEVAKPSHDILANRYEEAIRRRASADLQSADEAIWTRALWTLEHLDEIVARNLPNWLNKILANPNNTSREYKILRAHRRGLLCENHPQNLERRNWQVAAKKTRLEDHFRCFDCHATESELHVHHIVYKSNFGTDRKENLITLCRRCHEQEHGRSFDFGESQDTEIPNSAGPTAQPTPISIDEKAPTQTAASSRSGEEEALSACWAFTVANIDTGPRDFPTYEKTMLDKFGEVARPYLHTCWQAARNHPRFIAAGQYRSTEAAPSPQNEAPVPQKTAPEKKLQTNLGTLETRVSHSSVEEKAEAHSPHKWLTWLYSLFRRIQ